MKKILVVEDDRQIARMLRASLQSNGYQVTVAENGLEGLTQFEQIQPHLVITDLAMPELNGVEMTQAIRKISDAPVLVLSVRDSDAMKVRALDEGANDYLTKPFSVPELLARVRVQLRSADREHLDNAQIGVGDLTIDSATRRVIVHCEEIHLTPKEFDLLLVLAGEPGRVFPHKHLLRTIWGPSGEDQPEYLRVLVAQLRKKLDPHDSTRYIESEPWVGYRFRMPSLTTS